MTMPPWAQEPGLFQVICGCGGESFDFVITDFTIAVVCKACHQVNGQFDRPHDWQPFVAVSDPRNTLGDVTMDRVAGAPQPGPMVHVGWMDDGLPAPAERLAAHDYGGVRDFLAGTGRDTLGNADEAMAAKLGPPAASPEHANAILAGGHWEGRLIALPGGVENVGLPDGMYRRQGQDLNGRWIYLLDETTQRRL